jgi:hypothetical protein
MLPIDLFRFCPRCGHSRQPENQGQCPLSCSGCGLVFYFNPTVAAAAFVFDPEGKILLIRRAKDPSAGKLGVPGGFIDIGESAEEGLRREVSEEVGEPSFRPATRCSRRCGVEASLRSSRQRDCVSFHARGNRRIALKYCNFTFNL